MERHDSTHTGRSVGCGSLWNVELWTINVLLAVTFQCCCGCCLFVCLSWTELTGVLFYKICTEIFVSGDIWIVVVVVFFSPWHHWTTTHMSTNRDDFFILITVRHPHYNKLNHLRWDQRKGNARGSMVNCFIDTIRKRFGSPRLVNGICITVGPCHCFAYGNNMIV